jgi:hypothetical protein
MSAISGEFSVIRLTAFPLVSFKREASYIVSQLHDLYFCYMRYLTNSFLYSRIKF